MRTILTVKQLQVLKCIALGHDNRVIAKMLNNTEGRISNIRSEILLRMRFATMYEVIYKATKEGWI